MFPKILLLCGLDQVSEQCHVSLYWLDCFCKADNRMVSGSCKQSPQAPINLLFSHISGMDKKRHLHLQIMIVGGGNCLGVMFFADMQLVRFGGNGERSQFSVKTVELEV